MDIVRPEHRPAPDPAKAADAADRLWRELVRRLKVEAAKTERDAAPQGCEVFHCANRWL
jgi:hypothetical protein